MKMKNIHNMEEKWKRFVYWLIKAKQERLDEPNFQLIVEEKLELLGWSTYLGEIRRKSQLPSGRTYIEPDIVIKGGDKSLFVMEIKHPNHTINKRDIDQLSSYILQSQLKIGIYIGEHIEIFYNSPTDETDPQSLLKIEFDYDDPMGGKFVELFSKDSFDKNKLLGWCEERYGEMIKEQNDDNTSAKQSQEIKCKKATTIMPEDIYQKYSTYSLKSGVPKYQLIYEFIIEGLHKREILTEAEYEYYKSLRMRQ